MKYLLPRVTTKLWFKAFNLLKSQLEEERKVEPYPKRYGFLPMIFKHQLEYFEENMKPGSNKYPHGFCDAYGEVTTGLRIYNHLQTPELKDWEITYTFAESMHDRALQLKTLSDETQQKLVLLWSGGLDSSGALIALNEVCDPEQLKITLTESSIEENPNAYRNIIENRIEHTVNRTRTLTDDIQYDKDITIACNEADGLMGSVGLNGPPWQKPAPWWWDMVKEDGWLYKEENRLLFRKIHFQFVRYRQHYSTLKLLGTTKGNTIPLHHIQPFYGLGEKIQKYFISKSFNLDLDYYLPVNNYELYTKSKMPLRHYIHEMTGDNWAYTKEKINSFVLGQFDSQSAHPDERLTLQREERVLGLTKDGQVISPDNIIEFDLEPYIDYEGMKPHQEKHVAEFLSNRSKT